MANDPTISDQSKRNDSNIIEVRKCALHAHKLSKGKIIFRIDTGMAHKVASVSIPNGIEHFNLVCSETNSSCFLSRFAVEREFTESQVSVEKLGLKVVKRLSKMWRK